VIFRVITYRTAQYEKEHQYLKTMKERIMRYEPELAKPKADIYVDKKIGGS